MCGCEYVKTHAHAHTHTHICRSSSVRPGDRRMGNVCGCQQTVTKTSSQSRLGLITHLHTHKGIQIHKHNARTKNTSQCGLFCQTQKVKKEGLKAMSVDVQNPHYPNTLQWFSSQAHTQVKRTHKHTHNKEYNHIFIPP